MFTRLKHMLIKEFIQIFRDPRMKTILFISPLFQTLVFGYAASTDVKDIALAIYDLDNSADSRELAARFAHSGYFRIVEHVGREGRAQELLDTGAAQAVLRLNSGFAADLRGHGTARAQLNVDGTDSVTARVVLNYSAGIARQSARPVFEERLRLLAAAQGRGAMLPRAADAALETRAWFNENLESRNYYLPGVIAIIVTLITLMLTSMAVVREKELGTMEQIMVSPITPAEFILGKCIPFALIGFADVGLIMAVAVFWFEAPLRGSPLLLFAATGVYLLSTLGIGLLISTLSGTQQQAMMGAFFFMFPAMLLSGFMFPIDNMPETAQWLTLLNPLRYFMAIIRGIFLKGVGWETLWPQLAALAALGCAVFSAAARRFRKTLG